MQIDFTKKQFESLMKAVYLGNWMANAHRIDDFEVNYEEIQDYIFSKAPEFGFNDYVDNEKVGDGKFYPTNYFSKYTDVHELHNEYDEETFWHEIIDRLANKDFVNRYGVSVITKMSFEERMKKMDGFVEKWEDEINENGLNRIDIVK